MIKQLKKLFRFRSAETGRFIKKDDAEAHPATTTRERIDPK